MRKISLFITFLLMAVSFLRAADNDPVADNKAIVISGNMRFTVLTPEMIRMEWSDDKTFEDRASFTVINRKLPVPKFTVKEDGGYLYINTEALRLTYKIGSRPSAAQASSSSLSVVFNVDGKQVEWYPGKVDPLNLKGTMRTLDNVPGGDERNRLEDGILSRSGWALIDENKPRGDGSLSLMFENEKEGEVPWVEQRNPANTIDWYLLAYGHNYKKALSDYTKISGKMPMPPMYIFGYWYSKYQKYTSQDFKDIVNEVNANKIPLDILVIDMDWHLDGWTGWSWNKELIPDPAGLLSWIDNKKLKKTLNLHPADGIGTHEDNYEIVAQELGIPKGEPVPWNIENKAFYKSFFKNILRPHEKIGVDFWWLDWQQWAIAKNEKNLGNTFWINHVFYEDMKLSRKGRRPVIFHRWGGLGNHRYPIGFSGDTYTDYPSLAFQPYFTATASNVCYGYWSHDIGGHQQFGDNNPELYLRWIQYGVFSPIVRSHSANFPNIERRIWKYPNLDLMKEALNLRYSLIPYIYTYARYAYDTGISLCRPMYYDYPDDDKAYDVYSQYMFGNDILVSPIVEEADTDGISVKDIWLPEGSKWYEVTSGKMLDGGKIYRHKSSISDIPYYYKEGAIIPNFPAVTDLKTRPENLILKFVPGKYGSFLYYEDENDTDNYQTGLFAFTKIEQTTTDQSAKYTIHPIEGIFESMPQKRSYDLELLTKQSPRIVKVNGKEYRDKSSKSGYWSNEAGKVVIHIPSQSCSKKIEVDVVF